MSGQPEASHQEYVHIVITRLWRQYRPHGGYHTSTADNLTSKTSIQMKYFIYL